MWIQFEFTFNLSAASIWASIESGGKPPNLAPQEDLPEFPHSLEESAIPFLELKSEPTFGGKNNRCDPLELELFKLNHSALHWTSFHKFGTTKESLVTNS